MSNFRAIGQLSMDILHLKNWGTQSVLTNAVVFVCHTIGLNVLHIDLIYQSFHLKSMFLYISNSHKTRRLATHIH